MATSGMSFANLLSQIDKVTTKKTYDNDDAGYWKPARDKAGNGSATIRFLPNKDIDDFPFVRLWSHSFKNPENGRWYIENSLSTIGQKDYISEVNSELWNTGLEENKAITRLQKRKLSYISNVLVIKDPANPENEGKVFKFKFGMKIFDKIVAAAKPDPAAAELDEDDNPIEQVPINAYSPEEGANFMLKITQVAGFPNYDSSSFSKQRALFNGDETKVAEVLEKCFDLNLEVSPDKFKTPEELKKKFLWATGQDDKSPKSVARKESEAELDSLAELAKAEPKVAKTTKKQPPMPESVPFDDADDSAFFASLIEAD
jgi:hypothetical protein